MAHEGVASAGSVHVMGSRKDLGLSKVALVGSRGLEQSGLA